MADPGAWDRVKQTAEDHPWAIAGGVVALVIVIWWLQSGSSAPAAQPATNNDAAAAGLAASQISANAQTAQAQLAADVQNNQTAAAQTVGLAQIQAAADVAKAQAGASTDIAMTQAKAGFGAEALQAIFGNLVPVNGGHAAAASGPAATNAKPWVLALGDMLFGSQVQGSQVLGPAGATVDPVFAKYLGWTGGQQIGGGTSIDQLPTNPNSIFYTPKPSRGGKAAPPK